jgi:uncharacterized protein YndB with AHSA1/START domain
MGTDTDRIEKRILLRAPIERVWRAVSDSHQFGSWFGMQFDGPFVAGERITGTLVPTTVDDEVAKTQLPYAGHLFSFVLDRVEPPRWMSFRWHPFALGPESDYVDEPMTLVAFELQAVEGGTMLTVTESGFDRIPLARRAKAFAANEGGWAAQVQLIEKYVARAS